MSTRLRGNQWKCGERRSVRAAAFHTQSPESWSLECAKRLLVNGLGTKWNKSSSDVPCQFFGAQTQSEEMPRQHYDQHQKYSTGPNKVKTPDSVAGGYSKATQGVAKPINIKERDRTLRHYGGRWPGAQHKTESAARNTRAC